jgi:hypothetical protein
VGGGGKKNQLDTYTYPLKGKIRQENLCCILSGNCFKLQHVPMYKTV